MLLFAFICFYFLYFTKELNFEYHKKKCLDSMPSYLNQISHFLKISKKNPKKTMEVFNHQLKRFSLVYVIIAEINIELYSS